MQEFIQLVALPVQILSRLDDKVNRLCYSAK